MLCIQDGFIPEIILPQSSSGLLKTEAPATNTQIAFAMMICDACPAEAGQADFGPEHVIQSDHIAVL